ncbi:MAG TPA: hypothetical protein VMB18_13705 [Terriglobales bacterium]|nr:hypothetical protein [Terriglobales bacterium]
MKTVLALFLLSASLLLMPCSAQVQENFFGLHINKYTHGEPWPTVPFYIRRTVSDRVTWDDLETCAGGTDPNNPCYHFRRNREDGDMDKLVNDAAAHGVEVMFTVYDTAGWISNRGPRCKGKGIPEATCDGPADEDCGWNSVGLCDPPADIDARVGSGDADGTNKTFKDFITAVATRYGSKIKYWELWNEAPNIRSSNPRYWTFKQWARMTKDFHDVVKSIIPNAIILPANTCSCSPRGSADFASWTEDYFTALDQYGPSLVDGVSFHGYAYPPENQIDFVHQLQAIANKHVSTRGKPLYDTEDAWPGGAGIMVTDDNKPDWNLRSAWIARSLILTASLNVKMYIFFGWDLGPIGQMWADDSYLWNCTTPNKDGKRGYLCPTAPVYEQTRNWLLGATFDKECSVKDLGWKSGSVVVCDFTKNNGAYHGRFVWDALKDTVSYEPEKQFTIERQLDGSVTELKKGTIQVGPKPVLLEMK